MKHSHIATPPSSMEEELPTKTTKPINAKKISISMLVVSLPFLYVSLLRVPPSNLFRDTTFWFLVSNSIIFVVAADSGMFSPSNGSAYDLFYDEYVRHSRASGGNLVSRQHPEVVKNVTEKEKESPNELRHEENLISSEPRHVSDCPVKVNEKESSNESREDRNFGRILSTTANEIEIGLKESTKFSRSLSEMAAKKEGEVVTRKKSFRRSATEKRSCRVDESEYWRMSDEELNERVEDFIRKFNREIRLQAIMT